MVEPLEPRRLMRGGTVRVDRDTLYVNGTSGDDVIVITGRRKHVGVSLNGREQTFHEVLRHAVIYCGLGNDNLLIGVPKRVDSPDGFLHLNAVADGGPGYDTLGSGDSDDTLLGGTGNDTLTGDNYDAYNGRDYLDGGPGNDRLSFGRTMYGGSGRDRAIAMYSDETLTGGLEKYDYGDVDYTYDSLPIDQPNLYRSNGKLVFSFTTNGDEQESVGTYGTLADGRFDLRVHRIDPTATPHADVPVRTVTFAFNRNEAMRHGIVLRFTVPGSSRVDSSLDQTVLIATR